LQIDFTKHALIKNEVYDNVPQTIIDKTKKASHIVLF